MKILVLPSWYPPRGGEFFREHSLALAALGHEVTVLAAIQTSLGRHGMVAWIRGKDVVIRNDVYTYNDDKDSQAQQLVGGGSGGGSFTEVYSHYRTIPFLYRANIVGWIRYVTRAVQQWIDRNGPPGLIQVHSSIWAGVVAARIGRQYNIPYVVTEHRSRFVFNTPEAEQMFRPWHYPLLQEAFAGAARIITVSDALQQKIAGIMKGDSRTMTNHPATRRHDHGMPDSEPTVPPGDHGMPDSGPEKMPGLATLGDEGHNNTKSLPITTIPNMVDTKYFCPAPAGKPTAPFQFFSLAYLEPVKGFDTLIEAFNILNIKFPHRFRLVIGGDGSQRQVLGAMVARLGLQAVIEFTGALTHEEVRKRYRTSHVFVLASRFEAFGVVFIEAMSCGLPVIATRSGGPETFIGPDCGLLVNADRPEELATAMEQLAANYDAYIPEQIRLQTINRFSRQAIARKYAAIYEEIMTEPTFRIE
jgi:L-malate glycosyltransferase